MEYRLWIDGEWCDSSSGDRMAIENPATGEQIAEVANAGSTDVDRAVQAARRAFYDGSWANATPADRANALLRLADLLEERTEEFARVESENTGKPYQNLSLASDLPETVDNLRFFAGAARDTHGMAAGEYKAGYTSIFRREAVGVVGQIAPWNYPLMMGVWKIGPALAAGCTVVLKPAPTTPLTTLMLAELSAQAGFPPGVLNVVTGDDETGKAIVTHPDIRLVSLTGSTETGKWIMRNAADTLKRVHLELGGKAPILVFDDADIESVAEKAAMAATANSGQDCTAATRVYVQQSRVEMAKEAIVEAMRKVKVGDPFDAETEMGPLISARHRERVQGFVERAGDDGVTILAGGGVPKEHPAGYYFEPTVVTDADQKSEIIQQEVFGPVLAVGSFHDEAKAVHLGNDVLYGLAASVFTNDIGRAMKLAKQIEAGTVWINDYFVFASEAPHGGFKQSGFGKDLSFEAVHDYQITKHVMLPHG